MNETAHDVVRIVFEAVSREAGLSGIVCDLIWLNHSPAVSFNLEGRAADGGWFQVRDGHCRLRLDNDYMECPLDDPELLPKLIAFARTAVAS